MTTESSDTRPAGGDQAVDPPAPTEPDERVPMVEVIEHLLANLDAATLPAGGRITCTGGRTVPRTRSAA